jgi:hypothetical protein
MDWRRIGQKVTDSYILKGAEGVKPLRTQPGAAVFNIGAGKYRFEAIF